MTSAEVEALILYRWKSGDSVKDIRAHLRRLRMDYSERFIFDTIRLYLNEASENAKINRGKLWLCRLRRALQRFQ